VCSREVYLNFANYIRKFEVIYFMKVIVYSAPNCPYCTLAKDFLSRHKIKFIEYDVSKNREAAAELIRKTGQTGVPVIEIDGKIVIGFNKEEIKKALGIK